MTYRFIEGHQETWPIRVMCDALEVSPAGYYAWLRRPPSFQEQRREALLGLIQGIHAEVKQRYGSPRIHAALAARGETCSVNTVAKLMHDNDIRAKSARKFRCKTTDSNHAFPVAENVLGRQFDPEAANEAWVALATSSWRRWKPAANHCCFSSLSAASARCQRRRAGMSFSWRRKTRSDEGRLSSVRTRLIVVRSFETRKEPSGLTASSSLSRVGGSVQGRMAWPLRAGA